MKLKATKEVNNSQVARATNAKKRKRKRHGRYTLHYILIGIFVLAAGIVLSLTVFFKTEGVDVSGNTKYLNEQIIEVAGIPIGENIFMIKRTDIEKRILESFTYIDEVKLKYRLPPKILIDIKEAIPMSYVMVDEVSYAILSDKGKILEIITGTPPEGEALVMGLLLEGMKEGEAIDGTASEAMKMLSYVDKAMNETELLGITRIDISDRLNIRLLYNDRIIIEFGTEGELAYKMKFAKHALENSIEENFEGIIDASIAKEVRIRATKPDTDKDPIFGQEPVAPLPEDEPISASNSSESGSISGSASSSESSSQVSSSSSSTSSSSSSSSQSSSSESSSSSEVSTPKIPEIPNVSLIGPGHDIKTG